MSSLTYTVLKPFKASVDGEIVPLEPGEQIPGPRVPEIESWGRSIDHLLNTHRIAAVQTVAADEADPEALVALAERKGFDLAGHVLGRLDPDALLAHVEARIEPEAVLARFSDELLLAAVRERGLVPPETPAASSEEAVAKGAAAESQPKEPEQEQEQEQEQEPEQEQEQEPGPDTRAVAELKTRAAELGVEIPKGAKKADILALVAAAESQPKE